MRIRASHPHDIITASIDGKDLTCDDLTRLAGESKQGNKQTDERTNEACHNITRERTWGKTERGERLGSSEQLASSFPPVLLLLHDSIPPPPHPPFGSPYGAKPLPPRPPLLSLSRDITIFANPERAFSEWFHPRERVPRFAG